MELKNKIHKTSLNYIDKSFQFSELNLSKELFLKMFINVNRHNSPKKCDPKMKMSQYYFQNNTSTFVSPSLQTENSIIFDLTSSQKKRNASIKNSFNSSPKKKKSNLKTNTCKSKNSSEKSDRKKEKLKEGFFKKGYSLRISEQISPIPKHKEIDEFSKPSRKNLDALSGQSKENSNFMFEDSSLSRLKFLGIDSVVENISKLEEKNKDILSPEKGFVSIF